MASLNRVGAPLRAVVVGAGAMGMAWLRAVARHEDLELVGIVDVDERRAKGAAIRVRRPDVRVASDLEAVAPVADVCVNVTPPAAHGTVIATALRCGLAVLTEKPFADSLTEAVRLTGQARAAGRLLMVSQSRRYEPGLERLRGLVSGLGALSTVTTELGVVHPVEGFRATMAQPLLWDMAVHAFDAVRLLTGARPVAVYCEAFNPPWSGFAGPATATAIVELDGGIRYVYTGSWCADGLVTAWSGRWRVTGERGTAQWDGTTAPTAGYRTGAEPETVDSTPVQADTDPVAKPLDDFVRALRAGTTPWGEASDNLWTLAMAEAAVLSATTGRRVEIDEVLSAARRAAG